MFCWWFLKTDQFNKPALNLDNSFEIIGWNQIKTPKESDSFGVAEIII
jgi:hypothetical protein